MLPNRIGIFIRGLAVAVVLVLPFDAADVLAKSLPKASPASLGFSAERLARVDDLLKGIVEDGSYAGASMVVARHGKIVYEKAFGERDIASDAPMTLDTIGRIYSMTKPITGTALMILYEDGRFQLDDPVSRYLPELKGLKVVARLKDDGTPVLEDASHEITIRELMTHTAGFAYGVSDANYVEKAYVDNDVLDASQPLSVMVEKLGKLPLLFQPGTVWSYSLAVDVQGALIEKLSGQSFPDFLKQHIFDPLDMKDTAFYVPEGKRDRFATLYAGEMENGKLVPVTVGGQFGAGDYMTQPKGASGGAGLVSTLGDYLRFTQMMLNGGELDGVRILSPLTVKLMASDHLPEKLGPTPGRGLAPGNRFGLDFAVVEDPVKAGGTYGKGTFYWSGAAGTWFWIDPVYDITVVGLVQRLGGGLRMHDPARNAVYQALVDPGK